MSVLIEGMEMPQNCDDCRLSIDCAYDESQVGYKMTGGRPRNCPLVPVPPHGDSIDRDDFFAECPELVNGYKAITDDLVVVPAEEGE